MRWWKRYLTPVRMTYLEHGLEQRKTGMPIGESNLTLEQSVIETHGLLHARELLHSVQRAQQARQSDVSTGKDILAEEAASRRGS